MSRKMDDDHRRRRRFGEVAGGATAECAVMCCCIPVAIVNLLVLAVYKVPAGIGRKVWRRRKKERLLRRRREDVGENFGENFGSGSDVSDAFGEGGGLDFGDSEMWDELYGTGFWRVPSQKGEEEEIGVELKI
ncbi:hypothetical protein DCAR_0313882 [Daucus carota subsp. sativus]|uniref:Uncharacterized protein n=1 Tax=Daucus carota subsp. sativus TaxID=79200 RepID=A0AAF0WTJ3_DAUCS|nr:PREDICTED: uncharacterized protein LOC108213178 [Daucus carota subsp. sativus]WOG94586.1 hypothetical protein DCAR_0313882 [Daucus carota subsp. sativus]